MKNFSITIPAISSAGLTQLEMSSIKVSALALSSTAPTLVDMTQQIHANRLVFKEEMES
jgi:hypothetical protein